MDLEQKQLTLHQLREKSFEKIYVLIGAFVLFKDVIVS